MDGQATFPRLCQADGVTTPHGQPLPDFSIAHQEKIDWMVETTRWAIEPVPAQVDTDPPVPGYAYTISFPETFGFPEVLVFGLTPVAAREHVLLQGDDQLVIVSDQGVERIPLSAVQSLTRAGLRLAGQEHRP